MKRLRLPGLALCLILLSSCATYDISTDYNPSADFSDLKTWNWLPEPTPKWGDPRIDSNSLLADRIRKAVANQLAIQGYRQTSSNPDFLVGWHASIISKIDSTFVNGHYGYSHGQGAGPGLGWNYWGSPRYADSYAYYYDKGALILDIVNPKTDKLIWRGTAKKSINGKDSPEQKQKTIEEAVKKILAKFPPK
jgi:hypothetical protein